MTKHFVKLFARHILGHNEYIRSVESRTHEEVAKNYYGSSPVEKYQFFDVEEVESDGETLKGSPKNFSHYYLIGELYEPKEKDSQSKPYVKTKDNWIEFDESKHEISPLKEKDFDLSPEILLCRNA